MFAKGRWLWGESFVKGALADPVDRSSPGYWVFIALIAPCMLIGAVGGLTVIVFPIYRIFRIPMRRKGQSIGLLGMYVKAVESVM